MVKLSPRITKYPPPVTDQGLYKFQEIKEQVTRFGPTLISTLSNTRNEKFSAFIPNRSEVSDKSLLARLVKAYGDDTDQWIGKKVKYTKDEKGKLRIDPVVD